MFVTIQSKGERDLCPSAEVQVTFLGYKPIDSEGFNNLVSNFLTMLQSIF